MDPVLSSFLIVNGHIVQWPGMQVKRDSKKHGGFPGRGWIHPVEIGAVDPGKKPVPTVTEG
jgi:hypothetical protein